MSAKRFLMNVGRTTKQGQQINIGKDSVEYQAIVGTITMHPDDMKDVGIAPGGSVRVRSKNGEVTFKCREGKVPHGMIFVPYGPPTCRLMGQSTDGTGMPTSKGWEVEVEPISVESNASHRDLCSLSEGSSDMDLRTLRSSLALPLVAKSALLLPGS